MHLSLRVSVCPSTYHNYACRRRHHINAQVMCNLQAQKPRDGHEFEARVQGCRSGIEVRIRDEEVTWQQPQLWVYLHFLEWGFDPQSLPRVHSKQDKNRARLLQISATQGSLTGTSAPVGQATGDKKIRARSPTAMPVRGMALHVPPHRLCGKFQKASVQTVLVRKSVLVWRYTYQPTPSSVHDQPESCAL